MAAGPELVREGLPGTSPDENALTACDVEPIHIPGSIQPHGLLLIADRGGRVIGGAGAIEERLTPIWLGRPIGALLAQSIDLAAIEVEAAPGSVVALAAVPGRREAFDAALHVAGDYLLVELEPQREHPISAGAILSKLDAISTHLERSTDVQALWDRAAIGFRELTGFDRVMIYRFQDDAAGVVVAEDRDRSLPSFLNHHFPATDIPRQARQLYIRNRVRVIPDVHYDPAIIRSDKVDLSGIDLSDAALRSVSPIHLAYLRNMGVTASASISIVKDGLLWGLVACHNMRPRALGYELRVACRALAGGLARQIRAKEDAEAYRDRIRLRQGEDALIGGFDRDLPFDQFFSTMGEALRTLLNADGFVAVQGEHVHATGAVPDPSEIRQLARWLGPRTTIEPLATATLSARFAPAIAYRGVASGLLAVCLTTEVSTMMMWFRAEAPATVAWAGNPHKEPPASPAEALTPRTSFAAWRETVRGRSRRWTIGEIEAANRLRQALFEMRQSRRLRDLNRALSATIAEKDALLAEKGYLLKEVHHRVQNSLQLVQAFLGLQARGASPDVAAQLSEAQRRLSAVGLVHRRLYEADRIDSVDLARYLDELIGDMRQAMGHDWDEATTAMLAPISVPADRAITIGLVLTELVINAQKYAYAGGPGPIAIVLEPYRGQFRLIVADQGAGHAREREGFGTRMIRAMADRLGGTIEWHDNRPGLRVALTAPIDGAA